MPEIFISVIGLPRSQLNHPPNEMVILTHNARQSEMWYHHQYELKHVELLIMEKQIL